MAILNFNLFVGSQLRRIADEILEFQDEGDSKFILPVSNNRIKEKLEIIFTAVFIIDMILQYEEHL